MLSKDKIIYVRSLQLKFYKSDQVLLKSFFEFENIIFNFCKNINENMMIQVKLKWLQNEIINENKNLPFLDLITKNNSIDIKKKLIDLINIFSEIFSPLCDVRLNGVSNFKSFFFETSSILKYIIKAMINKIEADKIDTFKNKLFIFFLEIYIK